MFLEHQIFRFFKKGTKAVTDTVSFQKYHFGADFLHYVLICKI